MTSKNKNPHIEPEDKLTSSASSSSPDKDAATNVDSSKVETSPPLTSSQPTQNEEKQGKRGVKLAAVAIVLSVIFSGGIAFQMQQKDAFYQAEIAALKTQLTQTQRNVETELNQVKQDTIAKAAEATHKAEVSLAQQQKSIESLQLAVADIKGRRPNDWLLAEADYLVKLAGRKLFLEHDVVSATQLMESADQRIAALNDPSLVPLRKAMANDITKLKVIPLVDREGLVLRLTSLQQQVDALPLANAILPEAQQEPVAHVSENINDWQNNLLTSLKEFSENFITFRTRDGNVVPLLSPQQHFYLKENLKAKLETAIKAVYVEQQEIYTTALTTADKWSATFFNQNDNAVKQFNDTVLQLSKQNIQVEYPVKLETQNKLADIITERLRREVSSVITEEK
ncbi:uroporphyrinogen-III C-methyltransferase [Vibrio aestuarianus]|uniref:Uroporphyrinogen-III C-methyltransferase n=1 Tax=Vibrio aestuarianus TaxID=28171 RepID=A0A9X4J121_9VIBR|nr:uroporphyrinogen-III C-methyltransferase [Vibrio aestuarianus]MDE1235455.1 uroporphyrinogen-III C-methyltransferase [Vibrio aestuarianus]MDE1246333.1 uroporphyrinogen-III C-methyltransferase [Vibrio aestuarianus]MDE1309660.1 uroporphyrinogen-III C-methyltransferase [Vibrio aestuarianus]MDE1318943.1 uroporphyrinogen-III C-methyltransferase [Vibrio aestuarianus]MDE1347132.1 uroporphyrinogen-III C-methyltransferase [Vibrio aestuarianus]